MPERALNPVYLSALSPKDSPWDNRRAETDGFKALYQDTMFDRYAERMSECSCRLDFAFQIDENGLCNLKLQNARFCRVRLCPVCQGRRSMKWQAKAFKVLPKLLEDNPKARFIFLTLTVRNCELTELRDTLSWMHQSWRKLVKRKEFTAIGWIRSVEVTRGHDNTAHPHYHALLMVKPSYFKKTYISQQRWTETWQSCLGVDYTPIVDIRSISSKIPSDTSQEQIIRKGILETLKYSVKPSSVLREDRGSKLPSEATLSDRDWLIELTAQLSGTRAVATGGILKQYLKDLEKEPDDLIHIDENGDTEADEESPRIAFQWKERAKRYRMAETY